MKRFKQTLSLLLALLLAAMCALPAFAQEAPWEVDKTPTILVHGIMQSQVLLRDADGAVVYDENGAFTEKFLPPIDVNGIIGKVALPLLASLMLQRDVFLTKTLRAEINEVFRSVACDEAAQPIEPYAVVRYPESIAECKSEDRQFIYRTLHVERLAELIGERNLYYFAYDSFGNLDDTVKALYDQIRHVMDKHRCDKVNLVPISLGGAIFNSLIEEYPDVRDHLRTVVTVIGAMDGSRIVGDMYTGQIASSDEDLYRDMAPALLEGGYLGGLINVALRLFPKALVKKIFATVVQALVGDILSYNTTLWSLVPGEYYDAAAKRWLMDGKHDRVKEQTDRYRKAQANSRANIKALQARGVHVYAIAEYDYPLYAIADSWRYVNADGVVHLDSTSMGATSGYVGTPLPAGYTQKVADGHNHISPDGIVDASTCALPDHTFFLKGQDHEGSGRNDNLIMLITRLVSAKAYETVFSMEAWPQFNCGRETNHIRGDLDTAKKIDPSTLSPEDARELAGAIAQVEAMLASTIVIPAETDAAGARIRAILVKLGQREPEKKDYAALILDPVFWFVNLAMYYAYGPRGFSDPIWAIWK